MTTTILMFILGIPLFLSSGAARNRAPDLAIRNDLLSVRWDGAGFFEAAWAKTGRVFLREGRLEGQGFSAARRDVRDPALGKGESIEVTTASGNSHELMLYPGVPFVLVRSSVYNGGGEIAVTRSYPPVSFALNLPAAPGALRALGTAGLTDPGSNPGSYIYLAIADPATRAGVVAGWLTHDRGNGVLFSRMEGGKAYIDAQVDYGRLPILPGRLTQTETLAIGYFEDARIGLEAWAEAVAMRYRVTLPPPVSGYCTWYSKPNGGASDERHIRELAEFAARELKPFGLGFIQIDDKWQMGARRNGPGKNFTSHDPAGPYPRGMKPAAESLAALGFTAGLWFMPFAGDHLDPYFKDHPDWFVKRTNGEPYETDWGGTCLDMTSPGAREHLRRVAESIRGWGYRYFKMDGLWTGAAAAQVYVNDGYREDNFGDAVFRDPDKSNIEAMREGLKLVREAAGPGVFLSGCNLSQNMRSFSGSVGLVDSMRIGPDNGPEWPKDIGKGLLTGPAHGSRKYFMHGRIWWNDPDPVYVRASMPLNHAQLIASWVSISGQIYLISDWLPALPAERLDILKRTLKNHGLRPRPADLFESPIPRIWLLTDTRTPTRRDVVALYNWDSEARTIEYPMGKIGLEDQRAYHAFDYWENQPLPPIEGTLRVRVPAQSCRILALRPVAGRPVLLSTSSHVSQGIVDVLEEAWDDGKKELTGRSRLVAGDPYEMRVALPAAGAAQKLKSVRTEGGGDVSGWLSASVKAEGGLLRVTLKSETGGDVRWTLSFD